MSNLSQPIWEMAVHLAVAGGVFDCVFLYYLFSHRPTVTLNKWLQRRNSGLSTPDYGIFLSIRRYFNATELIVGRKRLC